MSAPLPSNSDKIIKDKMEDDLKKVYKELLKKYLEDKLLEKDSVNSSIDNILIEAKEYFIKKYPDYDLFLYIFIYPRKTDFRVNSRCISLVNSDSSKYIDFQNKHLHSVFFFFFYKHTNLNYNLDEFENEIIQKGNEILKKYLDIKNYDRNFLEHYNTIVNSENITFILTKEKKL